MPLYSFECPKNHYTEKVYKISKKPNTICCPICGRRARSIITASTHYCGNKDVAWCTEMARSLSEGRNPYTDQFIKDPNRETARAFQKANNIRLIEQGEKPPSKKEVANYKKERTERRLSKLVESQRKRSVITVQS